MTVDYVVNKINENGKLESSQAFLLTLDGIESLKDLHSKLTSLGHHNSFRYVTQRIGNYTLYKFKKTVL